eukprot:scaffold1900_cov123-Cylindrotheca_fusiformis.AAC.47
MTTSRFTSLSTEVLGRSHMFPVVLLQARSSLRKFRVVRLTVENVRNNARAHNWCNAFFKTLHPLTMTSSKGEEQFPNVETANSQTSHIC